MKKIYIVASLILLSEKVFAQVEGTMPFMTTVAQSSYFNPAVKPRFNFSYALPVSLFLQFSSNSLTWGKTGYLENKKWTMDGNKLASYLRLQNHFNVITQVDPFFVSLRVGPRLHLTMGVGIKGYARLTVPKGILAMATQGNAQYVGQTLSLSPQGEMLSYIDIGVGGAYSVNRKLTVGGRVKMLRGLFNFTTKKSQLDLTTQADEISVVADGDFRSSGLEDKNLFNGNNLGEAIRKVWENSGKNLGAGFDFGATYQVNDRLMVGASVVDLGFIKWTNNTYSYTLDPATGKASFKGLDLQKLADAQSKYVDSIADALKGKFKVKTAKADAYTTGIPTKIYLSGTYKLKHNITVNGLLFFEKYRSRFFPGFSTSIQREFGKRMALCLSYTMTNNSYNNIGLGFSTALANMQFYLVGDNLVRGGIALLRKDLNSYVNNMQFFTVRAGINIVIRWQKTEEKSAQPF